MCEVITCEYCLEQFHDFKMYLMLDGSLMCIDCVRDDVPVRGDKVVA